MLIFRRNFRFEDILDSIHHKRVSFDKKFRTTGLTSSLFHNKEARRSLPAYTSMCVYSTDQTEFYFICMRAEAAAAAVDRHSN